mgnify:CR=1 FL=1
MEVAEGWDLLVPSHGTAVDGGERMQPRVAC